MGEFSRLGLIRNTSKAQEAKEARKRGSQSKAGWGIRIIQQSGITNEIELIL